MSFADLKKNKGIAGAKQLQEELEKLNKKAENDSDDERYWRLKTDKSGVGAAVIRFLPAPEGEEVPWVRIFTHSFQGPGGWYIEKSLSTINRPDPVGEYNRELWNSGIDANKEIVRKQKRKLNYISNILVIKDPAAPENEGKVFLFKYGKKIFEKIQQLMSPEPDAIEEKEPINPFCPWTGANFKIKTRKVDGYPNYDQSEFSAPSPLFNGDDAAIEALWKKEYKLQELIAEDQFKSYDELKKRLDRVLGLTASTKPGLVAKSASSTALKPKTTPQTVEEIKETVNESEDDEETISDDLSYLQQLANEED